MKIIKLSRLSAAIVLSLASILAINMPLAKAAGTNNWTGLANNGSWITSIGNWSGGIPSNGQDLKFNNASWGTTAISDDIPGLEVNSLTFSNNSNTPANISLADDLTVDTAITQDSTASTTVDTIAGPAHTITLGGDVTVTVNGGLILGAAGDTIDLNGHTLTFVSDPSVTSNSLQVLANITGSGSVVYNSAKTTYAIAGNNTYSGTTHVIASDGPVIDSGNSAFGSSAITVETGSSIKFDESANTTINNTITVTGSGTPVTSIQFANSGNTHITTTVPHIVLNGNTKFANITSPTSNLTVNLSGITINGHCLLYMNAANSDSQTPQAAGFTGGPTSCNAAAATTKIGAPNTGLAAITARPLPVLMISAAAAMTLLIAARRVKFAKR